MKALITSTAVAALSTSAAMAGGYDRSGQFISDLFADSNVLKFSYERVVPSFGGSDGGVYSGSYDNIADDYSNVGVSLKADVNDSFSYAIIFDEPFGAEIFYPDARTSSLFGETFLDLNSRATTFVGRYKFDDGFSVHGGLRYQSLEIDLDLLGIGRSTTTPSYSLRSEKSSEIGYLIGAAYERPDTKLLMSLTYNSAIDYSLNAKDRVNTENFTSYPDGLKTSTPESWNFEFKKGVSDTTSLFGSIRYTNWGEFYIPPKRLIAINSALDYDLAALEDVTSYSLGVEHAFSENFSGSISITYETGTGELADTLAIFNGPLGFDIAGSYAVSEQIQLSGSLSYVKFDDASVSSQVTANTNPTLFSEFEDNSAFGVGFSVAYKF